MIDMLTHILTSLKKAKLNCKSPLLRGQNLILSCRASRLYYFLPSFDKIQIHTINCIIANQMVSDGMHCISFFMCNMPQLWQFFFSTTLMTELNCNFSSYRDCTLPAYGWHSLLKMDAVCGSLVVRAKKVKVRHIQRFIFKPTCAISMVGSYASLSVCTLYSVRRTRPKMEKISHISKSIVVSNMKLCHNILHI